MVVWKKKNEGYLDLSEKMKKRQSRAENFKSSLVEEKEVPIQPSGNSGSGFFGSFFGGNSTASSVQNSFESEPNDPEERKKKLVKRLTDMTNRMESMEKEIYQLKQKVEVLERKQKMGY